MRKMKEAWAEIMEDFDWRRFIVGLCMALAIVSFGTGLALVIALENLVYLLLWFVSIVAVAFVMGVEG